MGASSVLCREPVASTPMCEDKAMNTQAIKEEPRKSRLGNTVEFHEVRFRRRVGDRPEAGRICAGTGGDPDRPGRPRAVAASLDGTSADDALWLDHELNAVRHFGRSLLWLHHDLRQRRERVGHPGGPHGHFDHGGGFPIRIGTQTVGAIGVSGLPHEEDHRLIVQALSAVMPGAEGLGQSGPDGAGRRRRRGPFQIVI